MKNLFILFFIFLSSFIYSQNTYTTYYKYRTYQEDYIKVSSNDKWDLKRVVTYLEDGRAYKYGKKTELISNTINLPIQIYDFGSINRVIRADKYNISLLGNPQNSGINNGVVVYFFGEKEWIRMYFLNGTLIGKEIDGVKEGCCDGDCENGVGKYYYKDGSYYIGSMYKNNRHGFGTYFFTNGEKYYGQFVNNEIIINNSVSNASAKNVSSGSIGYDDLIIAGSLVYGAYKLFTSSNSSNTSKSITQNNSKPHTNTKDHSIQSEIAPQNMKNVEIIESYTFGAIAYEHAQIKLRNKNNYDVIVSIELKQGDEWRSCILSPDTSDMIGYSSSERYQKYFTVKANSMRTVSLKGDGYGRPSKIRIANVK